MKGMCQLPQWGMQIWKPHQAARVFFVHCVAFCRGLYLKRALNNPQVANTRPVG